MVNKLGYQAGQSCLLLFARLALRLAGLPVKLAGRLVLFGFTLAGRLLVTGLGLVLVTLGLVAGLTGVGMVVGIPLLALDLALLARGLIG